MIVTFWFKMQSSDDEAPKEEEELALQMQREKAKSLTMEDYGLVDISGDKDNDNLTSKVRDTDHLIDTLPRHDVCVWGGGGGEMIG